ncbi:ovarian-specific serine/threonine-protein kinase Lok-like [Bicyclus anynana]|uniref:Ovarian-specific serine/threonine-protein kinase Lok-like n=1 Tax=Bicyclus anynana TaxID=110368 RepID=A0A6J1MKP8_BICAN|nr:ovarian-specific serine/threonine-protein kinase Lok-like [Bicyclus anynana]
MGDDFVQDTENTQTQTQNSQLDWSQPAAFPIPNIWGRLYSIAGKQCWQDAEYPEYYDLIQPEFSLGRALSCTFIMKKDLIKEDIIKSVSKQHFVIMRDLKEPLAPAIITDLSYNGTFINDVKIGKGCSRVLDDNDVISVTHVLAKMFKFKDLLKNEQDKVPIELSQKYYISRVLGQGACGTVKLVYDKVKCTKYAMKVIKKSRLTNGQINHLNDPIKIMNEVRIMKTLKHPCIISTEEVVDSSDAMYIVMEYMQGGELFHRISKRSRLSERHTRFLFRQMVLAVKYLHSQGITHRDLKPDNVLLVSEDDDTIVKITDFGLSKFMREDSFMKTMCGTPLYVAPEVLRANGHKSYGPEVDVWSLGVIFFVCLVGYVPFSSDYYKEMTLQDQILSGNCYMSPAHWKGVSLQAKLLMKRMLTVNVNRRITLDQILNHCWMQDDDVNLRIENLLSLTQHTSSQASAELSSNSDEENNNNGPVVFLKTIANNKRALSNSFSSSEPVPKKLRVALYPSVGKNDNSSTTDSYCSQEFTD